MTDTQNNKVLVSHSSKDASIADAISKLILKCSLRQILPWYSSDSSGSGGIQAGERWFEKIRSELGSSRAVIVLVTPNSLNSSWVHFESGFGAANGELEIIPIIYGIEDIGQVPDPLSHWQIFRISHADECIKFLEKLFSRMNVHFDREIVTEPARSFFKDIENTATFEHSSPPASPEQSQFESLRKYLDKKFFDLAARTSSEETNFSGYDFDIRNTLNTRDIRVHIDLQTTFSDVLDDIYFQLEDNVKAYTYLSEWILKDEVSGQRLIIQEIGVEIPARIVLPPERKIVVELIKYPYSGSDSGSSRFF